MNKITKGAIAAAAGVVLLMGGAGTLAYWNDSDSLTSAGTTITAGNLDVAPIAAASDAWKVASYSGTGSVWNTATNITDIDTFRMVPGDRVTYTRTATAIVEGTDIKAKLALTGGALSSDLSSVLTKDITMSGTGVTTTGTAGEYNIASTGAAGVTVTITVTLTWPNGTTTVDNALKTKTGSLAALNVALTQVFS